MAMTFTTADLASAKEALMTGAKRVRIGEREIEYRDQKDLLALISQIESYLEDVSSTDDSPNNIPATFSKGQV